MVQPRIDTEWPTLGTNDPPVDFTRENAAYEKERERFGLVKMMLKEITASDSPEYIANVDINHPSFRKLD